MIESKKYPKVAFCTSVTPATEEHYQSMKKKGIETASICLHLSGMPYYKFAAIHTSLARKAGMTTHALLHTTLEDPVGDVTAFTKNFVNLQYTSSSKITIWVNPDQYVEDAEFKIRKVIDMIALYHPRTNIDLAFFSQDLHDGLYDLHKLPSMINLTVFNLYQSDAEVREAGTWVYAEEEDEESGDRQLIAYDFYGYYTEGGFQLSIITAEYVVQPGDTWHSISRRHGIPLEDLLKVNRALEKDPIYSGQVIRLA